MGNAGANGAGTQRVGLLSPLTHWASHCCPHVLFQGFFAYSMHKGSILIPYSVHPQIGNPQEALAEFVTQRCVFHFDLMEQSHYLKLLIPPIFKQVLRTVRITILCACCVHVVYFLFVTSYTLAFLLLPATS